MPATMLADELQSSGNCVYPREGTPLGEMLSSLRSMDEKTTDVVNEISKAATPINEGNVDMHAHLKQKFAAMATERMDAIVDFTRNVINPAIREILEGVDEIKGVLESNANSANITIRSLSTPKLLNASAIEQTLDNADPRNQFSSALSNVAYRQVWSDSSVADIVKTCMTSYDTFNGSLVEFIQEYYPANKIKAVDFNDKSSVSSGMIESFEKNNDLICLLFLQGLYQNRHPNVPYDELSEQDKLTVIKLIKFWSGRVAARLEACNRIGNSDEVILVANSDTDTIYVNRKGYDKWLNEGGTADTLIGYWLSTGKNPSARGATVALSNKQRFNDIFLRHQTLALQSSTLEFNRRAERYITEKVIERIKEGIDDTQECHELIAKANAFYGKMGIRDFSDGVDEYARFMVCKTIGKDSDSLDILSSINSYKKQNPKATMDEAILDAMSERLACWIADQLIVVDKSADLRGHLFT